MTAPHRARRRCIARLAIPACLALLATVTSAHVGTLDTFYAGRAGPWTVQVTVRPPGVVPGRAQVLVRVLPAMATKVTVQASQWDVGPVGAPPPDRAARVPGSPDLWSAELWLMTAGSYAVNVVVDGASGVGTVTVPVASLATKRLGMQRPLGIALMGLGVFLCVGLVSIVGAATREGVLTPGEAPDGRRIARARGAMVGAAVILLAAVTGGWRWWRAVDRAHASGLYAPMHITPSVRDSLGARMLRITIDDPSWRGRQWTPLVPDHGKMMHLFLVRAPSLDAFAHLHPTFVDSSTFDVPLGALPPGRYRMYADVVHESGLAQTLTDTLDIAAATGPSAVIGDPDDALFDGTAARADVATLGDGAQVAWRRPARLVAKRDAPLVFTVRGADGAPTPLEPYMGMPGHAMVSRADGGVFMHLHGMGSISLASQAALEAIEQGDTLSDSAAVSSPRLGPRPVVRPDSMRAMPMAARDGELAFPFAFPEAGRYRIWVQFARGGRIETAAFDATVEPAR